MTHRCSPWQYIPIKTIAVTKEALRQGLYWHSNIGLVAYSDECIRLEQTNPDPSSVFVNDWGEIKEVSIALLEEYNIF